MTNKIGIYRCENGNEAQWRVRWYGRYDPGAGKLKRYSKTFDKMKDAKKFKKQKQKELEGGAPRDPSKETLKEYTVCWLKDKTINENLRPASVQLYQLTLKRLYNHFGPDMLMRKIDRRAAKTFLAELKPINDREKPLGNWSRHRVLRQCKTLFSEAVKDGVTNINPFAEIKRPKCTPSEWYYMKPDEFHKLLYVTPKLNEKVLYALAYTAGLRESEVLALYWTNIDFDKGVVNITNRSETKDYPPFEVKDTDNRTIPLPKLTLDLLTELQLKSPDGVPFVLMDKQGCQRIRSKWEKCLRQGRPWLNRYWANNTIRNFHRRVKWAGIETNDRELTVHVLRKCCGRNWADTLPMNVVKSFMGHADISTTEKFYSIVDDEHLSKATETMNDLLKTEQKKVDRETTDLYTDLLDDFEPYLDKATPGSDCKSLNTSDLDLPSP